MGFKLLAAWRGSFEGRLVSRWPFAALANFGRRLGGGGGGGGGCCCEVQLLLLCVAVVVVV